MLGTRKDKLKYTFIRIYNMGEKIKTIREALAYSRAMGYEVETPHIKYKLHFKNGNLPIEFANDKELIQWCEEEREKIHSI